MPGDCPAFRRYLTNLCELQASSSGSAPSTPSAGGEAGEDLLDLRLGWPSAEDTWCLELEPAWLEFAGSPVYYPRPLPLLAETPLTFFALKVSCPGHSPPCIGTREDGLEGEKREAGVPELYIIGDAGDKAVELSLNHFQYLYLMRTIDALGRFAERLQTDAKFLASNPVPNLPSPSSPVTPGAFLVRSCSRCQTACLWRVRLCGSST